MLLESRQGPCLVPGFTAWWCCPIFPQAVRERKLREKLKRKKAELEKRQSLEENAAKQKQLEEARRQATIPFRASVLCQLSHS